MLIVRLLSKTNSLWQFEAGQLETVFQGRNPHDEERAQLRLPLADVAPQFEIPTARGAELEKYAIGKSPYLVQICVDRLAKSKAPAERNSQSLEAGSLANCATSRRLRMNVLFISTAAGAPHSWSNTSHIMNRPSKMPTTRSRANRERGLYCEFLQVDQVESQSELHAEV